MLKRLVLNGSTARSQQVVLNGSNIKSQQLVLNRSTKQQLSLNRSTTSHQLSLNRPTTNHQLSLNRSTTKQQLRLLSQAPKSSKPGLILGIETSCDDTCAAVLHSNRTVLSNVKSSQIGNVVEVGGVMTVLSIRLHSMAIHDVVRSALRKANVRSFGELSAIAVTVKPGQITSLDIGIRYAQQLALTHRLPLIPIHHMEAHGLTAMNCFEQLRFPFLALLVSGGHSQIALFKSLDLIYLIGNSLDCGPGEVLDKLARLMKLKNLGAPFDRQSGGQSIEQLAKLADRTDAAKRFKFSDLNRKKINNCNFNYNGMRSHYKRLVAALRGENERYPPNTVKPNGFRSVDIDAPLDESCFICADLQANLVNIFASRLANTLRFVEMTNVLDAERADAIRLQEIDYLQERPVRLPLVVSGGVACNDTMMYALERKLKSIRSIYAGSAFEFYLPRPLHLCTDNATMIAWNGVLKYLDDPKYLLREEQEIKSVRSEFDAKLGIDITSLVKKTLV